MRVITLQQTFTQIELLRNRTQTVIRTKWVSDEQPIFLRHAAIPTRAIDGHINKRPIRNIEGAIVIQLLNPICCSQVSIYTSCNFFICVSLLKLVTKNMTQKCIIHTSTRKGHIDPNV
uniref:Uncharacterized protein n=1 Tax=Opuntia streptacantha TaxID=393608 RepID=A0A7C9AEN9_OPUST